MESSKSFCSSIIATTDDTSLEGTDNDKNHDSQRPDSKCTSDSSNTNIEKPKSKKYQKVKYEIDRQRFVIAKLNREIKMKSQRGFPSPCLHKLKVQVCNEQKKLKEMIKRAIEIQASEGNEKWGPIQTSLDNPCEETLKPPQTPSNLTKISAFTDLDLAQSFLNENDFLENDRCKLQEELLSKDCELEQLGKKIENLQCQLLKVCKANKMMAEKLAQSSTQSQGFHSASECESDVKSRIKSVVSKSDLLTCQIQTLERNLCQLRHGLSQLHKEKNISFGMKSEVSQSGSGIEEKTTHDCLSRPKTCPCSVEDNQIMSKLKNLQSQYTSLQVEFCRKEKEYKDMTERMKACVDDCKGNNERIENQVLKNRADTLVREIGDYKIFIKELQKQVDLYRDKFMTAQEKVEYQRYLLDNLEMSNKDVEQQINDEISKIKEKFQSKLAELCPYPKMYEESRLKLEESKEKIEVMEKDLKATVAALCQAKCELKALKEEPNESMTKKYKKLQCEVEMLKKKSCAMKATKECLEEKLTSMRIELDNLRADSSKIISTTKCCAEKNRQALNQHIDGLEVELARCRASASLSLTEKEEVIKKMKNELAMLCAHFNDCQGQIKQLKNQVTYLTNQRHNIRLEDLDKIDCCALEF